MIIIADKNKENTVYFAKNLYNISLKYSYDDTYDVILNNRATNVKYEFNGLEDQYIVPKDYYSFIINFSNVPEDEYEYLILDGNKNVLASGIIKLKSKNKSNIYYDKNNEYIVYNKK